MMAATWKVSRPVWALVLAGGLLAGYASSADAQTTWQGEVDERDPLWSIGDNWTAGMPDETDLVTFSDEGDGEGPSVANAAPAGVPPWEISGFLFDPDAGAYEVSGEDLIIGADGIVNTSPEEQIIANDMTLGDDQAWVATTNTLGYLGEIELDEYELTFEGNSVHVVQDGGIHGEDPLAEVIIQMDSGGLVAITAEGTYEADTTHISGGLLIGAFNALGHEDSSLIIEEGGESYVQAINGPQEVVQFVELHDDLFIDGSEQLEFSGGMELFDEDRDIVLENTDLTIVSGDVQMNDNLLTLSHTGDILVSGDVSGSAGITFETEGIVRMQGTNDYTGVTTLDGSTLELASAWALGNSEQLDITDDSTIRAIGTGRTVGADTVNLTDDLTLDGELRLTFDGEDFNVSGGESTLTVVNTGANEIISDNLNLDDRLIIEGNQDLRISSDIGGTNPNSGLTVDLDDDAVVTLQSDDNTYTGETFVEDGVLQLTGDAQILESDVVVNGGRFHLDTENTLSGADVAVNDGGVLTGVGQVGSSGHELTINDGGLVSPGQLLADVEDSIDAIGTLNVEDDFEMADGGEYLMQFNVLEDDHDRIIVGDPGDDTAGDAELAAGSQITVQQLDAGFLRDEATMDIVESGEFSAATQTAINNDDIVVDYVSLFVDFELSIEDDPGEKATFRLTADRTPFFDEAVGRNNRGIARAMDELGEVDPLDENSSIFLGVFDQLADFDEFNAALEEVSPERYTALPSITIEKNQAFNRELSAMLRTHDRGGTYMTLPGTYGQPGARQVSQRFDPSQQQYRFDDGGGLGTERSPSDDSYDGWSLFGTAYGTFDRADSRGRRTGYSSDTVGFLAGLDRRLDNLFSAGLALGYSYTDIDFRRARGNGDIHTFRIGPYVDYNWQDFYATAALSYGYHDNSVNRHIRFPGFNETARGKFDAHDASLHIGTGYTFWLRDMTTALTPFGTIDYTYYYRSSFSESGAGGANLDIGSENIHSLEASLGLRVERHIRTDGPRFVPYGYAAFAREFLADSNDVDFQFAGGGSTETISGPSPQNNSFRFGLGVSALLNENVSTYLSYDGRIESGRDVHGGAAGFTYRF